MAGETTTQALADSLPTLIHQARTVREYPGVMEQVVDKAILPEGTGLVWNEARIEQINAQAVGETDRLQNPETFVDSLLSGTPVVVGVLTVITDRTAARISRNSFAELGKGMGNAIRRIKNDRGLTLLDGFTGFAQPGAGNTLSSGHIAAAVSNIQGNTTENGGDFMISTVLHPFQVKDIWDELTSPVGTAEITSGLTNTTFVNGYQGSISSSRIHQDGNIVIDASSDAIGATFAKPAIVLVQGRAPRAITMRDEKLGGGATEAIMYDEFVWIERRDVWGGEHTSDATAPTS